MTGGSSLVVRPEVQGGVLIAHLAGRFGQGSYGEAFKALRSRVVEGICGVVLDLEELDYLSSAGLAAILRLQSDLAVRQVGLRLAGAPDFARRLFEAAGMDKAVRVHDTVPEAVAALSAAPPAA